MSLLFGDDNTKKKAKKDTTVSSYDIIGNKKAYDNQVLLLKDKYKTLIQSKMKEYMNSGIDSSEAYNKAISEYMPKFKGEIAVTRKLYLGRRNRMSEKTPERTQETLSQKNNGNIPQKRENVSTVNKQVNMPQEEKQVQREYKDFWLLNTEGSGAVKRVYDKKQKKYINKDKVDKLKFLEMQKNDSTGLYFNNYEELVKAYNDNILL